MRRFLLIDIEWDEQSINEIAKHGLRPWEVEEAALYDADRRAKWLSDEKHGDRLQVLGTCEWNGKLIRVFVRPYNEESGIGKVITAWRVR